MDYNKLSDSELATMVASKQAKQNQQSSMPTDFENVSDEELATMLVQREMGMAPRQTKEPQMIQDREASLGFGTRAKYALEPIASNRKALLEEKYGKENVVTKFGDLFIKQDGYLLPVNKPGFSTADVADIAGALPETIPAAVGSFVGGAGGAILGAPTGIGALGTGAAGIAAGRAIGGGIGSIARQGLSAALGTPQVATLGERAIETGLSAITAPIGGKIADVATPYLGKLAGGVKSIFQREAAQAPGVAVSISPGKNISQQALAQINQPRSVVQDQFKKLKDIAMTEGLPEATFAQASGGNAILAEKELMQTPLVGGKLRKYVDEQTKAVKKNLENIAGTFIDADSSAFEVGLATKELARTNEGVQKKIASELYDQVDKASQNAMVGKKVFFNKFRDFAGKHGMITPDLKPEKYSTASPLTRDEFSQIQGIVFDAIDAIKENPSPRIRFEGVNSQTRKIKNIVEKIRLSDPNTARILSELKNELETTSQNVLNRESPRLGEIFKEANSNWKKFRDMQSFNDNIFSEGMGEEKIVKKLMSDSAKIESMKDVIGAERVNEIGISYIKDILEPLSKSGVARADSALSKIKANSAQIKAAMGEDAYTRLTNNLYYLNRVNEPLNISRTSLYSAIFEKGIPGATEIAARTIKAASNIAKSKGTSITKSVTKPLSSINRSINRGTIGNILTTQQQTEAGQ